MNFFDTRALLDAAGPAETCDEYTCGISLGWRVFATTSVVVVGAALANAAGVGGGALWVPVFHFLMAFGVKAATSTSQAVIAAGAAGGVLFLLFQRHPEDDTATLIDYNLAAVLTPPILFGVSSGVLFNVIFPDWLLTILLTILLFFLSYRPTRMGWRMWKAESSARERKATDHREESISLHDLSGEGQDAEHSTISVGRLSNEEQPLADRQAVNRAFASFGRRSSVAAMEALSRSGAASAFAYHSDEHQSRVHLIMDFPVTPLDFSGPIPQCFNGNLLPPDQLFSGPIPRCFDTRNDSARQWRDFADPYADTDLTGPIPKCFNTAPAATSLDGRRSSGEKVEESALVTCTETPPRLHLEVESAATARQPFYRRPLQGLSQLAVLWVILVTLEYFKATSSGRCSSVFVTLYALQAMVVVLSSGFAIWQVVGKAKAEKVALQHGQEIVCVQSQGILDPTYWALSKTAAITTLAGALAGLMGIGGGMVMGPLMLELGVHPQVTAATSAVMVLFSSSAATAQLMMLKRLNLQYAALFAAAATLGGIAGVSVVKRLVAATGRLSVIVLMLAATIATGAILTLVVGSIDIARTFANGEDLGFNSFCAQ